MPMRNFEMNWKFPELVPVPSDYQLAIGGSTLVSKILYQRGLTHLADAQAFLDPDRFCPSPPGDLPGLIEAADRLSLALKENQRVLVWGDFDVDGQTSTTLLFSALSELGADIVHHIPIRATESHGISLPVLSQIIRDKSPQVLLSCDTGIDAVEAVDFANRSGVDVIITDHHQLPPTLPQAQAIINPNLLPAAHPLRDLPGVGVAYKLIEELFSRSKQDPHQFLDLVALGIVADVARQTGDTRYLLQRGLEVLRNSPRPGLLEIYNQVDLQPAQINEETIGFLIGPRLNALGRLDDANSCVEFFTTEDVGQASKLADRLDRLNSRRQELTEEIYLDAQNKLDADPGLVQEYPVVVLAGPPDWNPGVIGIVASRLVERYHKPAILLTADGEVAKGSARSVPGVPISDLIASCQELLLSHGGHPMAAGLSLPLSAVSQFRSCLKSKFRSIVGDALPEKELQIDAELLFQEIDQDFIQDFHRLAPFGAGNPKLTFASRGVSINSEKIKTIGRTKKHRKLTFQDSTGTDFEFLWWNSSDIEIPAVPLLDIAYSLELSSYRGRPQIQATIQAIRPSPDTPVYLTKPGQYKSWDLRDTSNLQAEIQSWIDTTQAVVWAERQLPDFVPSVPRSELSPHSTLVIWTTPPSRLVLKQIIEKVSPSNIIVVGDSPIPESLEMFIQSLYGLIKNMLNHDKEFDLTRFSQALAYPEDMVEIGLKWAHYHGDYDLGQIRNGIISPGPRQNLPGFAEVDDRLKRMLQEVISFRSHFNSAALGSIL